MIPQRTLAGTCEITTGQLSITQRPPVYTGEISALRVAVSFTFQGSAYTIPNDVEAEMYLKFPNTEKMTVSVPMEISGATATGVLSGEQTGIAGYPLLIVQLNDTQSDAVIVACATPVKVSDVRGKMVVDTRAPTPSEIIYVGRSPYINQTTGSWMIWDTDQAKYVDTGVVARGLPATFTAQATTLPAGSPATASIGGTVENPVLNLGIPKGQDSAVLSVNSKTGNVQLNDEDIPSTTVSGQTTVEGALSSLNSQKVKDIRYNNSNNRKLQQSKDGSTYSDVMTVDDTPTSGSANPVSSNGAYLSRVLVVSGTFSSSNGTNAISNANITATMVVINSILGTPSAQTSDWTITTTAGAATLTSGTISGQTTVTLYLMEQR